MVLVHNKCKYKYSLEFESYDDSKEFAMNILGDNYTVDVNEILVSENRLVTVRFDTDLSITHVQQQGPHINLQIWDNPFRRGGREIMNIHLIWRK